jgi:hypothetical protein
MISVSATTMTGAAGGERADGRLLVILLLACTILPIGWIVKLWLTPEHLFPDFFGLWSAGRFVLQHSPAGVYDDGALQAFQRGLGMTSGQTYPFSYPPWLLLVLAPLGALSWGLAEAVWLVLTFSAYVSALAAWRWPRTAAGLLLVAPSSAICFLVGQNGFLTAALILGGLRLLWTRPVLAGVLLATAAYKPQFAILLPFVLLFGGHGRAMVGGALAVAGLSLASTLAFGPGVWGAWLAALHHNAAALAGGRAALLDIMPTVTSAVLLVGGGMTAARILQVGAMLAALFLVWRLRKRRDPEALAALALAVILAAPYAFYYDLPVVTGAALAVIAARTTAKSRFRPMELPAILACILSPAILIARPGAVAAVVPVIFALVLWVLSRPQALQSASTATPDSTPPENSCP